jgi:hypothetical protein
MILRWIAWLLLYLLPSVAAAQQGLLINGSRTIAGTINAATTTGTGTAYLMALDPPITGYIVNQCFTFRAHVTNTGAVTLNVNGVGIKPLKKYVGTVLNDLVAGDITGGQIVLTCYDGTTMQMVGAGFAGGGGGGIGYTAENVVNKSNNTALGTSTTDYPSVNAVKTYVDTGLAGKQATLGFAPETSANKKASTALGTSDQFFPTQNAVKSYVDTGLAGKQATLGFTPENFLLKSPLTTLGTSDEYYPTQNAVKTYVDAGLATKANVGGSGLSYTPEDVANKSNSGLLGLNPQLYPTQAAVKTYVDTGLAEKQATLGFAPENSANKSDVTGLGTSPSAYPTQRAVKAYVDAGLATKADAGAGVDPTVQEQALGAFLRPYVYSGCLPGLPGSGITLPPVTCHGFVHDTSTPPRLIVVTQAASVIGPLSSGDGVYWLGLHLDTASGVSGWTRQSGTHYLWQKAVTKPLIPSGQVIAKVTVAGSSITLVEDWRVPGSYVRNGTYEVTDPLYGGVANDSTDVGPALRTAIAAASAQRGGIVRVPQGRYVLGSAVTIPEAGGITIAGDGWTAPAQQLYTGTNQPFLGTWLHIQNPGFVPLTIRGTGSTVKDLAFDHDQPAPAPGWAPTDYPYVIVMPIPATCCAVQTNNGDINLTNLFFFKATRGIQQHNTGAWDPAGAAGRINIRGLWGQFFSVGIDLKFLADVGRISDVHMWPWWSSDRSVISWQEAVLQAIVLYRCDSCMLNNIFLWGAYGGLSLLSDPIGATTGLQVTNFSTDVVRVSLFSNQNGTTGQFVNMRTAYWDYNQFPPEPKPGGFATSSGIVLQGPNGSIDIVNFEGIFFGNSCVRVLNSTVLTLFNVRCEHTNVDASATANGVLQAIGGGVILTGGRQRFVNTFGAPNYEGALASAVQPGGASFDTTGGFFATMIGNRPTVGFAPNAFIQWFPEGNALALGAPGGAYNTGGAKRYVCIQDGVLTVGTSCP